MINFCPPFFNMRRLRDDAINHGKAQPKPNNLNLWQYDNTARVMTHEITHLDFFMESDPAANHITDLSVSWYERPTEGPIRIRHITQKAYGPDNTKKLARYQEYRNPPITDPAGHYVSVNADNLAWFATAKYIQDRLGNVYPHLPIVTKKIDGPPWKPVGSASTFSDNGNPIFDVAGNGSVSTTSDDPALPPPNSCSDDMAGRGKGKKLRVRDDPAWLTVNISGMANDFSYPQEYRDNVTKWLQEDFNVQPPVQTFGKPVPTQTFGGGPVATPCQGNNCVTAGQPSATP